MSTKHNEPDGSARGAMPVKYRLELAGAWSVVVMLVLFGAGFVIGYLPPPRPGADPAAISTFYLEDPERRRIGALLFILGSMLFLPFAAALSGQMLRIKGTWPGLAWVQFAAAAVLALMTQLSGMFMLIASFRADRDPALVQALGDLGWLPFVGAITPVIAEVLTVAIAGFADRSPDPVIPRWLAWFSLWVGTAELTGLFVGFFQTGPFAWNGIAAFYIAAVAFFAWYVAVFIVLRNNLLRRAWPAA